MATWTIASLLLSLFLRIPWIWLVVVCDVNLNGAHSLWTDASITNATSRHSHSHDPMNTTNEETFRFTVSLTERWIHDENHHNHKESSLSTSSSSSSPSLGRRQSLGMHLSLTRSSSLTGEGRTNLTLTVQPFAVDPASGRWPWIHTWGGVEVGDRVFNPQQFLLPQTSF